MNFEKQSDGHYSLDVKGYVCPHPQIYTKKALSKIRFEAFTEGKTGQTLHIGPFSEEGPTIKKVHDFIVNNGHKLSGKHHEIYLSDIRRAAPEKWKTIIRQPYK